MKWTSQKWLTGKQSASWAHSLFRIALDLLRVRYMVLQRKVLKTVRIAYHRADPESKPFDCQALL
jgi:hypothetical protein